MRWLAVAPVLLLGPTAPAVAETVVNADARHDVERTTEGGDKDVLPQLANGDITRHRLTYADGELVAVIRFRELKKPVKELWVEVPIRYRADGEQQYGEIELKVDHDGPQHPDARYTSSDLGTVCGVPALIDYRANVIRLTMPADCIGTPPRLRAVITSFYNKPYGGGIAFYQDTSPNGPDTGPGPVITLD